MFPNNITPDHGVNTYVVDLLTDPSKVLELIDSLTAENLHINPIFIDIAGSITGGYYLTQLMFLSRAFQHKEFFKTDRFFKEKYRLTKDELRAHRPNLIKRGFISVRKGQGNKNYYTVNRLNIYQAIHNMGYFSCGETPLLEVGKPHIQKRGNPTSLLSNNNLYNKLDNKISCPAEAERQDDSPPVKEIFQYWQQTMKHPKATLGPARASIIKRALKLYKAEDIKKAIVGCSKTPHNMGDNERGEVYDDLHIVLNEKNMDRFMRNADSPPKARATGGSSAERASRSNKIAKDDLAEYAAMIKSKRQGGTHVRLD